MNRTAPRLAALALAALTLTGCGNAVERLDNSFNEWNWHGCTPEERSKWEESGETPPLGDGCYGDVNRGMSLEQWQESAEIEEKQRAELDQSPGWPIGGGPSSSGCVWSPTMNRDWHDDYVCGGERQYFLPNDNFIEQWEIDAAAREWENNQ